MAHENAAILELRSSNFRFRHEKKNETSVSLVPSGILSSLVNNNSGVHQRGLFLCDLPQHLAPGAGMFSLSTAVFQDTMSSPPRGTPEVRPADQGEAKRKINALCERRSLLVEQCKWKQTEEDKIVITCVLPACALNTTWTSSWFLKSLWVYLSVF